MPSRADRPGSLATQISIATLGLVTLSVVLASVLVLGGVYNLARQETAARLHAFRDILLEDLTTRFVVADLVVDSAVTQVEVAETQDEARAGLYRLAAANTEYFDVMILADPSGDVLAAWPPAAAPASVADEPYFDAALEAEEHAYTWQATDEAGDNGRVWISQALPDGSAVASARLRLGFVGLLVDEISSAEEPRAVLVTDEAGRIVEAGVGGPPVLPADLVWEQSEDDPAVGDVSMEHESLGTLDGYYAEVSAAQELGWRVVVLEPVSVALDRTQEALIPASLAVVFAAIGAMGAAFIFGRRLANPLRLLEQSAREVASGSYIEPIEVEREDEVGRLAIAFNAMAARVNALQDLSQLLASASELDQVLDSILSAMEHILGTGRAAIFMIGASEDDLDLVKASGARVRDPEMSVAVAGPSWVSQAFRSGRSVSFIMSPDDSAADPVVGLFATDEASSGIAVPLAIGHRPFGVILVVSAGRRSFTEAETEMARAFSAQAAIAVQNSRLFTEEHESRMEAEALRDMAELLAGAKGLEATLDEVGNIAAGLLGMTRSYLAMPERHRKDLDIGPSEDPEVGRRYLDMWDEIVSEHPERLLAEPMPVEGLRRDPSYTDLSRERGVESVVLIPTMQGDRQRGVLVLECGDPARTFSERDLEAAYATGKTLAVALDSHFLFNQARRRAENLEMIFRISQAVSLSLQTTIVLNRVMDVVQKMVTSTGLALMQYDARRGLLTTAMVRGIDDKRVLLAEVRPGEDIPGQAFESRHPVVVHDLEQLDTPMSRLLVAQGFRSWLCAPLLARGRSIGVLSVFGVEPGEFRDEDTELVATFASQAALALDTAEMFEREHTVASVLQKSIVPDTLPPIEWLETSSTYQPAGSESEIGGDYYDLFPAPDGRLVLVIGDVCGKGVRAATKTSIVKYMLRGLVAAGLGPAAALAELNAAVAETGDVADIVTVWLGYLDPEKGRLTYASAGHPPALMTDGKKVMHLEPTGPLLGAIDDAEYTSSKHDIVPGTTLLLYTDGVTEARGPEGLFGEDRLAEVLAQGGTADEVGEHVVEAVGEFTDGVLRDDVAMLIARYRPE